MLITYSQQQQAIFDEVMDPTNPVVLVKATAGSAKTSSLVEAIRRYKQIYPQAIVRFLVFGSANAEEARQEFGHTAIVSTLHAMAYSFIIKPYGLGPIRPFLTWRDLPKSVKRPFGTDPDIISVIDDYCLSKHLSVDAYIAALKYTDTAVSTKLIAPIKEFLNLMANGSMPCTHGFYLKLFHIFVMNGTIKLPHIDRLLVDEFQDMSELALDIINAIPATQKVFVGDSCLIGSTKVLTSTGWKRLDSIVRLLEKNKPVLVQSYNQQTDTFEFKPASNPQRTGIKDVFIVKGSKTTIIGTANHKILTTKGYKRIDKLDKLDLMVKYKNKSINGFAVPINSDQYQILLGSYLGDGNISKTSPNITNNIYRLTLGHSISQINYMLWKARAFNVTVTVDDFIKHPATIRHIKDTACNVQEAYTFSTTALGINQPITIDSITDLSPLGLAIWLMDDGSVKSRHKITKDIQGITLSSNAFTLSEQQILQKMLFDNFDLSVSINKDRAYYELNFNKENSTKLLQIVKPYLSNDFVGKFLQVPIAQYQPNTVIPSYAVDSIINITPYKEPMETFDITVADNHNFVVAGHGQQSQHTGVVVHNCQAIFEFLKLVDGFQFYPDAKVLPLSKSFRVSNKFAPAIQQFLQEHLDPNAVFEGMDYPDNPTIRTRAYLTRNNASLIAKMIKLNKSNTPYHLSHKTKLKQMFKLPLALVYAKPAHDQRDPELKHLQQEIDDWGSLSYTKREETNLFKYLQESCKYDNKIISAIQLVLNFGSKDIIDAYNKAEVHRMSTCNYSLSTGHASKG